tara:strand:- start:915 stop:1454 length:540 start_codon:yes stop_codon:yes gene_type:complete
MKEKTLHSKCVFKGSLLDVRNDEVIFPNGSKSTREWINHPGAVCCIPVLENGDICLIRQFRYAVKKYVIELPAGKLESGEMPIDCARRELEEEIGFEANKIRFLTMFYPAVGFVNEEMHLFLAEDLKKTNTNFDEDEFIELIPKTLDQAVEMIYSGEITDAKTIIGLVWAQKLLINSKS